MIIKNRLIEDKKLNIDSVTDIDTILVAIFHKFKIDYTYIGVVYVEDIDCMTYSFRVGDRNGKMDVYFLTYNIWKNEEILRYGEPYRIIGFSMSCTKMSNHGASTSNLWNIDLKETVQETKKEIAARKRIEGIESANLKAFKPIKTVDAFFNLELIEFLQKCIDIHGERLAQEEKDSQTLLTDNRNKLFT